MKHAEDEESWTPVAVFQAGYEGMHLFKDPSAKIDIGDEIVVDVRGLNERFDS